MKEIQWKEIKSGGHTVNDIIYLNFYKLFESLRVEFYKTLCYNKREKTFNNFYENISVQRKKMTYKIDLIFFKSSSVWTEADTDDFILKCFFGYMSKGKFNEGIMLKKYDNNCCSEQFCSTLKVVLKIDILKKINYNVKQTQTLYVEDYDMYEKAEEDKYENLLKCTSFIVFKDSLKGNEKDVIDCMIEGFKNNKKVKKKDIANKLGIHEKSISRIINSIYDKYMEFLRATL